MSKVIFFVAVIFGTIVFESCKNAAQSTPEKTTEQFPAISVVDRQAIEKEISTITRSFFQGVEKLDIDACMSIFENTPEFLAANPDGTTADYNSLKKMNGDGFSQMSGFKSTLNKESIRVLSVKNVLYTFFAMQEFTLKTGGKMKMDHVAGTILFEKINNTWKATFYHESGAHPVPVETK